MVNARQEQVAPEEATRVWSGLAPGLWKISLTAERGGNQYAVSTERIDLQPGTSAVLNLAVNSHLAVGTILHRNQPLGAASVRIKPQTEFRGADHEPTDETNFVTDSDGRFAVLLSNSGAFAASIHAPDLGSGIHLGHVEISAHEDENTIHIPDGYIDGLVLEEQETPFAGARVQVFRAVDQPFFLTSSGYSLHETTTDTNGGFHFDALPEGLWRLAAQSDSGKSREASVDLAVDEQLHGVSLVLKATKEITVRIERDGLPWAQVKDMVWPVGLAPRFGHPLVLSDRFTTDDQGLFHYRVPDLGLHASAVRLNVVLMPTGGNTRTARVALSDYVVARFDSRFGRVEIQAPAGRLTRAPHRLAVVHEEGGLFQLGALGNIAILRAAEGTETMVLPALQTGNWRLVELVDSADFARFWNGETFGLPVLGHFSSTEGQETTVEIEIESSEH